MIEKAFCIQQFSKYLLNKSINVFFLLLFHKKTLCILRGRRLLFPKTIVFISLKIHFVLANSADPDEMQHYAVGLSRYAKSTS